MFRSQFNKQFADKLVSSLMYYSYDDFTHLINALINEIKSDLYRNEFLKNQLIQDSEFEIIWNQHIKDSCFVAITDEVGSSSHIMLSILKNRIFNITLTKNELCSLEDIKYKIKEGKKFFYIFDDFIGRGDQLSTCLLNDDVIDKIKCENPEISICLAFAIILKNGYERIKKKN